MGGDLYMTVTHCRILTLIIALLFVPAFMMGMATIWIFIGAFSVSLLFHKQLLKILELNPYTEHKKKNSLCLLKHYFLAVLEICVLSTLPILIFMNIGEPDIDIKISGLDDVYISALDFKWFFLKDFVDEYYQVRVFILYFSSALLSMFITSILSWSTLFNFFSQVMYVRDTVIKEGIYNLDQRVTAVYSAYSGISYMLIFFFSFLFYELMRRLCSVDDFNINILSIFCAFSVILIYSSVFLFFSSYKAIGRQLST